MFRTIDDFLTAWEYEIDTTSKLFAQLTDGALAQRVTPERRSLGKLAWHVTASIGEMLGQTGLKPDGPTDDAQPPASAREIREAFDRASRSVTAQVREKWTDETLLEKHDMYGQQWANGSTLLSLILHQAHHRGQMMVLMRQAGLVVTGPYGPAKEEWAAMGMTAPE